MAIEIEKLHRYCRYPRKKGRSKNKKTVAHRYCSVLFFVHLDMSYFFQCSISQNVLDMFKVMSRYATKQAIYKKKACDIFLFTIYHEKTVAKTTIFLFREKNVL